MLVHCQAGSFGFKVAQARPDKVKALIAVEPAASAIPPRSRAQEHPDPDRLRRLHRAGFALAEDPRHRIEYVDGIKAAGGSDDVIDLPKAGIKGNSHMMMMDRNNAEVAALIQNWLEGKGLTKKP